MNDKLKKITSVGFVAAVILMLVLGCNFSSNSSGGKNSNADKQTKNSDQKKTSGENDTTAKSEGLAGDIIGTWEGNPGGREKITMIFEKNGSVVIETADEEEKNSENATYRVIDEQTVEVKFSDGATRKLTDIKISGDTMQAKGKRGEAGTFKRAN